MGHSRHVVTLHVLWTPKRAVHYTIPAMLHEPELHLFPPKQAQEYMNARCPGKVRKETHVLTRTAFSRPAPIRIGGLR
jgi:hypothetical protein